ncbi:MULTISPECIES: AbiV family abortive infection protein [Nocardia]|uniref:AbiV family abortive infection protein n=1 Tax=Nocardia abscessus TaxID=120957 RepID=UPI002B4AF20D|nr:AbiV family abortive infection protein [Nocardia abscessus]
MQDALLQNADNLLNSAIAVLELGNAGLARSLAILALEESGKAIAIRQRRVEMAYEPEGTPFVNQPLRQLWGRHEEKLRRVHRFLVQEDYWFDVAPPDPDANLAILGTIEEWSKNQNVVKQKGFYVDVEEGVIVSPSDEVDEQGLRDIIGRVHQIGWQLRLGEHIEAKRQAECAESTPPASPENIEAIRKLLMNAMGNDGFDETTLDVLRHGGPGMTLNNEAYRLHLPSPGSDPFESMGKPGYEAQTRELLRLGEENELPAADCPPDDDHSIGTER